MKKFIELLEKIDGVWFIMRCKHYDLLVYLVIILIAIVSAMIR